MKTKWVGIRRAPKRGQSAVFFEFDFVLGFEDGLVQQWESVTFCKDSPGCCLLAASLSFGGGCGGWHHR